MKTLTLVLMITALSCTSLFSQAPQAFKYQALARDEAGNILANSEIGIRISMVKASIDGQPAYVETQQVKSNPYGVINIAIGEGKVINGNFSEIRWGDNSYFIKIELDLSGGTDYKEMGTTQLYAVPYALYAEEAGKLKQPEPTYKSSEVTKPVKSSQHSSGTRVIPNSKISSSSDSWLNAQIGNVGIGTTTPAGILDIAGAYHFPDTDGTNGQVLQTDGSGTLTWNDNNSTYSVGDFAQGGIVFWVDETGQHGLVCAKQDHSSTVVWYAGSYGDTRAYGDGPLAGEMNTSIIISAQVAIGDDGTLYAARVCNELQITEGGKTYGDWYLPSKEELNLMYENKTTIDATAVANAGSAFAGVEYWSSTEDSHIFAWRQSFDDDGSQSNYIKLSLDKVRAIRAF